MSPLRLWSRLLYRYTDDFGRQYRLRLNDYIGDAAGLERVDDAVTEGLRGLGPGLHARYVRVRGLQPNSDGRRDYRDLPVQVSSPLWTGPIGQIVIVHDDEFEVIKRVPEIERGRKKRLAEEKARSQATSQ